MILNIVWILVLFGASTSPSSADLTASPDVVKLNVISNEQDGERRVDVNLVPTETFLANENVPVWITEQFSTSASSTEQRLISLETMKEIGPFTVYWDLNTCSAALYFHKWQQFEGTIGHHHIIHKLNYNSVTKEVGPTRDTIFASPIQRHSTVSPVREINDGRVYRRFKSLGPYPTTAYVETLVIVNHDIAKDFKYDYASIVTYVLTLFNTVDMVFSEVQKPYIKINIAGIIIATKPFSKFIQEASFRCRWITVYNYQKCVMRAVETFKSIRLILDDYEDHIPFQSYDVVVFLTRSPLVLSIPDVSPIEGIATVIWNKYRRTTEDLKIALISEPKNFKNVFTIAHEIAHLLGAPHDGGLLRSEDGLCEGNIMRSGGSRCDRCITFSSKTQKFLEVYFGSTDACIFHNKPRSLNGPSGQRLFWTPRTQCECYGFRSDHTPSKCLSMNLFSSKLVDCASNLKCVGERNKISDTNLFMDGTPCARSKKGTSVCWNQKCVLLPSEFQEDPILQKYYID